MADNSLSTQFQQKIITILALPSILSYIKSTFHSYLSTGCAAGRFDYYEDIDFIQDIHLHLFIVLEKRIAVGWNETQLDQYFTPGLIRIVVRNYVIDLLRTKSTKVAIKESESIDNDYLLELARHTDNTHFETLMEEYLISSTFDNAEEFEFLEEVFSSLPDLQKEILSCILLPRSEFIDFFQFYLRELGIKTESEIIAKFLGLSRIDYFVELHQMKETIAEKLGIELRSMNEQDISEVLNAGKGDLK